MEHPKVTQINRIGYPKEPDIYGMDFFGNEVYYGDEIYIYEEEFWLADDLSFAEREILEFFEAKKICATNTDL